ncbi:MAG: tetratricopeptide repeat protein [Thermoleophilia bacterium]|nr:tetratricopeptide repeat protein [Thermoleophilia bacterium]
MVAGIVLPCVLAAALYLWGFDSPFLLDDHTQVVNNVHILDGSLARSLFSQSYFKLSGEIGYRPVLTLNYVLERLLWVRWGDPRWAYHATNLVLHLGNVVLVFLLARRVLRQVMPSAIAATLFAVHPLNSEVVVVLTFRDDSLGLLFLLGGLLLFARGEDGRDRCADHVVAALLLVLGAFAKEQVAIFPLVLLMWWWTFERGRHAEGVGWKKHARAWWPYLAAVVIFVAARWSMSGVAEQAAGLTQAPLPARLFAAPRILLHYLGMLVFPLHQSYYYPALEWQQDVLSPISLFAIAVVAAVMVLTVRGLFRRELAGFCGAWFLVMALPVANVVPINNFAAYDRYLYATTPVLGIGAAAVLMRVRGRLGTSRARQSILWTALALWTLAIGARTAHRVVLWRDGVSLWANAALVSPHVPYVRDCYGKALNRVEKFDHAAAQFLKALDLAEQMPERNKEERGAKNKTMAEALKNLGVYYSDRGEYYRASGYYERAIELDPASFEAGRGLVEVYQKQGQWAEVAEEYRRLLTLRPHEPEVLNNLADVYLNHPLETGASAQSAVDLATQACEMTGWARWQIVLTLAEAHLAAGDTVQAQRRLQQARGLAPDEPQAREALSKVQSRLPSSP